MTIIYALIARDETVLVEYTQKKGNFQSISRQILEKVSSRNNTKVSYKYDNFVFHILVDKGFTYFCMSEQEFGNRIPFLFLEDIKNRFSGSYGERAKNATALSLNSDFGRVLRTQMEHFSNSQESDKIHKVRGQIQEVKDVMIDNIEKVLDRGEKIDLLVDKTADLSDSAHNYRFKSKKLKNAMWWKNVKLILILVFIIFMILLVVIWFLCGIPDFRNCRELFKKKK